MRKAITQAHALSLAVYVLTSLYTTDSCFNYHCIILYDWEIILTFNI